MSSAELPPEEFARSLGNEERALIDARDLLYGGAWDELENDLKARKLGKPYIFRLVSKIDEDLGRIDRLRRYEAARGVDLGGLLRGGKGNSGAGDSEVSS